ncbi:hypothetical protein [Nocardia tengchongensis]|uniref:hypothetical protein n=1 Tax=Nocardia tengchongensis TaxID=2055889 RepID=UPI0036BB262B
MLAIAEVDHALARLDADRGEITANLAELEHYPGVRFLDEVPLTGVSAARWAAARARLDRLWAELRMFEGVVAQAHRVRARPGAPELTELTELLRYRRAHELLHSTPCDLAAATRAVTEFQRAITEKTA